MNYHPLTFQFIKNSENGCILPISPFPKHFMAFPIWIPNSTFRVYLPTIVILIASEKIWTIPILSKIARYFDYFNRWWKLLLISKTLKFIKRSNFRKKCRHSICLIKLINKTGRNVSEFLECDMNFEEVFFHYKHFWCSSSFRLDEWSSTDFITDHRNI